jgi:hypothetical protein
MALWSPSKNLDPGMYNCTCKNTIYNKVCDLEKCITIRHECVKESMHGVEVSVREKKMKRVYEGVNV